MTQITTGRVRKWVTLGMTLVLVTSLIAWFFQRETFPRQIRIATGARQGLYHKVGSTIRESLKKRIRSAVDVEETDGSAENFQLLLTGQADLAIVQGGSVPIEEVSVITPLFREFVFVIVRKGTNIQGVWELAGRKVCLGRGGSGNRDAALKVLQHFGIDESDLSGKNDLPFTALSSDESMEAAIVTAGIEHPSLRQLLSTNQFDIVPIRSAMAMELVHPFVRNVEIPRGLFAEHPAVPSEPIPTIATTAYLVCRNDAPGDLVQAALGTIHEESLRLKVPTLIARQEAPQWTATRMHPTAHRYFNPEDNIGAMVSVMESLVATKELLFAIGAGIYLLWMRWRRLKEKELQAIIHRQKERLDRFLMETLRIEKEQTQTDDVERLQGYLESVTRIKLQALQELTEEDLRGNQEFSIFLDQCSHLIGRMQLKILSQQSTRANS
jgi:TRAP transporter TAXI family solute receptor